MHSHLFKVFWRRKLSALLISSSLLLFALWTWTFFDTSHTATVESQQLNVYSNTYEQADFLQKLIFQANRVLRSQHQQTVEQRFHPADALKLPTDERSISEAKHTSHLPNRNGILRFVKPSKSPPTPVEEASAQTISLVARRKNTVGAVGESYLFEDERLRILENQQRVRNAGLEDIINNNMDDERMLSSVERQTQYEHDLRRMGVPVVPGIGPDGPRAPNERLVHLDLKGAPPKLKFLKSCLPMWKSLGATGLLIEYEDMFPYTGAIAALAARNAYKPDELKDFLETVSMHGLTVMPLVQTFGHMEFALKLQCFEHMREISESPQSICPTQQDSVSFIQNMLTQVIEFHLPSSWNSSTAAAAELPIEFSHIHIGCDEVSRMGECRSCRQRSRHEIFLSHVITSANFVRNRWPQLHVVIWDDMMRDMTLSELQHSQIGSYVEPMIWVYTTDIYRFIQPQLWDKYSRIFPMAWAASAFKGAFGESLMIPPLQQHLENNLRWLAVISKEGGRFSKGFKGLVLTGWQRYDHFAILCELLPTSMPSLITSLSSVSKGYFSSNPRDNGILKVLECAFHPDSRRSGHPWIELHPNSHHSQLYLSCTYPGSLVYKYTLHLYDKLLETQNYMTHVRDKSAWMSDYNLRHNFSAPLRVHDLIHHTPKLIDDLTTMAREAHEVMFEVFDEHTIAEFVEQHILPTIASLRRQLENAQTLLERRTWPQRPLPPARELLEWNLMPADTAMTSEQMNTHPH